MAKKIQLVSNCCKTALTAVFETSVILALDETEQEYLPNLICIFQTAQWLHYSKLFFNYLYFFAHFKYSCKMA